MVYFEGYYIGCNGNKKERENNELIKNTSYCNHRI